MSPLPLVPLPASVLESGGTPFRLDDRAVVVGDEDAAALLHRLVATRTGLRLPHLRPGRDAAGASAAASDADADAGGRAVIDLAVDGAGRPESYRLTVTARGVRARAADAAGLFYAVHTLVQAIDRRSGSWAVPALEIDDAPRFPYRGVMLDVARHFHDPATIAAYVERAAALKFNVLHLHLTDDQAWRLALDSRPELAARSADNAVGGDAGGSYSSADYRGIVAHAASHHMTVVPEFDMPGHTHAVGLAYPDLVEPPALAALQGGPADTPVAGEPYRGIGVGFSSLRIGAAVTDAFVAEVFAELAALTPGPYLHFGGDEAHGTPADAFADFVSRTSRAIADLGKTPIAWHEAGAATGLAPGTIGQYWSFVVPVEGAAEKARTFVRGGGRLILSPADAVYLDMKPDAAASLGLTWANGPTSVERAYAWEPAAVVPGVGEADILGVEAPLWTETVRDLADIDALAFPRIGAAAEAAWSPATGAVAGRTWESFRERIGGLGPLWTTLGIRFPASAEIPWSTAGDAR
ncbi:family 20 glycosylhydrolase [Microbacterium radiodurans]|uniref:beta-N-acetylhexosaminidase n=1 Tax=Microbacterium radiodurans TaxID=661398 RepID=A0A5J5IPC0_9MICO|nr:family 20 glycosylhydrolase [Microbacterium radiodurans]KAA9084998.1 family 20 glycosylhydrolase [Microbacterium radiodurans]